MDIAENTKRVLLTAGVYIVITYLCSYFAILYSLIAYTGYVFATFVISWLLVKGYRKHIRAKTPVSPTGKAVFITGCDSGFGNRLAISLDELGFLVFAGCLFPEQEGALSLLERSSRRIQVVKVDVTSDESVRGAVHFVENNLGTNKFWCLINNAGVIEYNGVEFGSEGVSTYSRQMDVNVFGVVRSTRAFLPLLRNCPASRIILLGSVAGRYVSPAMIGYSMSKYAVRAFGEGLRREMKHLNVYVSVIEPVFYKTAISDEAASMKQLDRNWQETPAAVKAAYGDEYFANYRDILRLFIQTKHQRVEDVTETIVEAVQSSEPEFYYRVCYFFDNIINLLETIPEEINDCISNERVGPIILRLMGFYNNSMNI